MSALVAACGSSKPAPKDDPQADLAACSKFAATLPGQPIKVVGFGAETAGLVARTQRLHAGHAVHPWDELPANHPVVGCALSHVDPDGVPIGVTTSYVIDNEGRHTVDPAPAGVIDTGG